MNDKRLSVSRVFEDCRDLLKLRQITSITDLEIAVHHSDLGTPGLLLSGHSKGFLPGQIQILGQPELGYLTDAENEHRLEGFKDLLERGIPCIVVTDSQGLPEDLAQAASQSGVPVFSTPLSASQAIHHLNSYLEEELAPESTINGTLVDVYGVGILLRGKSGIGKSECALDLVERGHRLVADDLVRTIAKPPGILVGRSSEPLQNYVEVRGVGLIDIGSIFGVRALRRQKRIEVEVNLREWEKGAAYDRSGLESRRTDILGVQIPSVTVPLVPGKNVSVIVEVIALSHTLKAYGYDAAAELDQTWIQRLRKNARTAFEPRDME
jgi:HPr kinase/phosphorylase